MARNRNIDIIRAAALLLVLIYHCWVKIGSVPIGNTAIQLVIQLGGEIGVTAFFALSGYGIYCSLYRTEQSGEIHFVPFMKKRLRRILPQYYLNLLAALLLTNAAVYFSTVHIGNIAAHFLLLHNLFPSFSGAVNGVLWTMGVIFQFYLFAIPLYKFLNKTGWKGVLLGILVTVFAKYIAFHYILDYVPYSFWLGRNQIVTVLDNFLIGMLAAFLTNHQRGKFKRWMGAAGCALSVVMLYLVCKVGILYGIHTDNLSGYLWHSEVAVCIGAIMLFACYIGGENKSFVSKILLGLSKYEYGIYLWHLLIIDNLIQNSPMIQEMLASGKYLGTGIIFMLVSIGAGILTTRMQH